MADYNYFDGKKRIEDIIKSQNETQRSDTIPDSNSSAFTFDNGYYGYVTAIFVDIVNSTELFNDSSIKRTTRAKIIRSFTSEVIEILNGYEYLRDIGIRGDCVYAIYTSPSYHIDYEIFDRAAYINTFSKMLNGILKKNNMRTIKFGIGIATGNELVVKAGRKGANINDLVWIGKAVTYASHFSNYANRNSNCPIIVSQDFYDNLAKAIEKDNPSETKLDWFRDFSFTSNGHTYRGKQCDVIKSSMNNWVENGMKDNDE